MKELLNTMNPKHDTFSRIQDASMIVPGLQLGEILAQLYPESWI